MSGLLTLAAAAVAGAVPNVARTPVAFTCKIEDGLAVVVDPARRRTVISDAGITGDQYGNRIQSEDSVRPVATMNARGLSLLAGCRRVTPARRLRITRMVGPWPARVFSRVLCGVGGPGIRFDAIPIAGGYRLTIALPGPRPGRLTPVVSTEHRGARGGGISLDLAFCFRLSK